MLSSVRENQGSATMAHHEKVFNTFSRKLANTSHTYEEFKKLALDRITSSGSLLWLGGVLLVLWTGRTVNMCCTLLVVYGNDCFISCSPDILPTWYLGFSYCNVGEKQFGTIKRYFANIARSNKSWPQGQIKIKHHVDHRKATKTWQVRWLRTVASSRKMKSERVLLSQSWGRRSVHPSPPHPIVELLLVASSLFSQCI